MPRAEEVRLTEDFWLELFKSDKSPRAAIRASSEIRDEFFFGLKLESSSFQSSAFNEIRKSLRFTNYVLLSIVPSFDLDGLMNTKSPFPPPLSLLLAHSCRIRSGSRFIRAARTFEDACVNTLLMSERWEEIANCYAGGMDFPARRSSMNKLPENDSAVMLQRRQEILRRLPRERLWSLHSDATTAWRICWASSFWRWSGFP